MSLYPQSQGYAQVGYAHAGPAYPPHQPPPQPSYYGVTQAMFYADPTHFRRDYTARLGQLTFNSRPHIQSLSMIAQDYTRYADIVVQCVEQHIRRAPPHTKLPAFYLLDAMSKNVFDPYARLFAPVVVRLFLDTYEVVDQATRHKMEEMLGTWRTGAPTGRQLFGVVAQQAIEREIWGGQSTQSVVRRLPVLSHRRPRSTRGKQNTSRPGQAPISTAQVLSELEFVLSSKERTLQVNPYDKQAATHVQILQQLRKVVQAGVPQDDLGQILTQLRTISPAAPTVAQAPPVVPISQPYPSSSSAAPYHYPTPVTLPSIPSASYPISPSYPPSNPVLPKAEPAEISSLTSVASAPVASTSTLPSVLPINVSSLFNKIMQTGVLSSSASSTPPGSRSATQREDSAAPSDTVELAKEYTNTVLTSAPKLTSVDILKHKPAVAQLLYSRLPGQCKQCGLRFPVDASGKKRLEEHLDMHFAQNRKASQANGRGYNRSWFVSIDDWLNDGIADPKGKRRAVGFKATVKGGAADEAAQRDAELRAMRVVVPPGDETKSFSCPICKEILKPEFNEDDEEWVWRNAVLKDERIYHATCHAEAMLSKTSLATRLKEETGRSRSQTPELLRSPARANLSLPGEPMKGGSPSPSKLVGSKRKVDAEGSVSSRDSPTPPMKKVALSAA
ncbi:hypothetical protein BDY19DRAFT_925885 [Irpex rosettiformis]|uniref:Uncharacterized protein n=1 Tax=Irpex rosettiformis TaxID=378272 RepID=A0ACB8UEF2_9APHY|nr:hypothetical protein BDY19DRAFT_925885 [Irpex rosettiformis]